MDDLDLATRLDRSIGSAPDGGAPLPTLIAEGRRVVRRRRLRTAAASLAAVVVVVGGGSLALANGGAPPPSPDPASETFTPDHVRGVVGLQYSAKGEVEVAPGFRVVMRIDNPYNLTPPDQSVAMVVEDPDGRRYWCTAFWFAAVQAGVARPMGGSNFGPADTYGTTFQTFVDQSLPAGTTTSPARTRLVRFEGDGFSPLLGVTVLEQRNDVDLGSRFATDDDDVAAAEVRSPGGDVYYVLGRQGPGLEPWVYVVTQAEGGADLDAFLDYARDHWGGDRAE